MRALRGICLSIIICLMFTACGTKQTEVVNDVADETHIEDSNEIKEVEESVEEDSKEPLPFKDVDSIKQDIIDNTDIVGMAENMYSDYYACFNDIYIDNSEYTDEGYTATCRVEFSGGEYMLTQNYLLFYKVNEQGSDWELIDYVATDEMDIVNCVEDTSDLDDPYFDGGYEGLYEEQYTSTNLCGTYVYQAVKFPDNNRGCLVRDLWIAIITDDSDGNYFLTSYTITAAEYEITKIMTEGDAICHDRYPVYYDAMSNTMKSISNDISIFEYTSEGSSYCNRRFTKIAGDELSTQEIVNTWISDYDE